MFLHQSPTTKVKAIVTVKTTIRRVLLSQGTGRGLDDIVDALGKSLLLELVSAELDSRSREEKATIKAYAHKEDDEGAEIKYEANFEVGGDFGELGAVFIENEHHEDMFVKDIVLQGFSSTGSVHLACESWIHGKNRELSKRLFFTNKSYLPSQTPEGLRRFREEELLLLRGNGQGQAKKGDQIYDYDVYDDLGNPDLKIPVLGGKQLPYPRRCQKDPQSESRSVNISIPRYEVEERHGVGHRVTWIHGDLPPPNIVIVDPDLPFTNFKTIDSLFNKGIDFPHIEHQRSPPIIKTIEDDETKEISESDIPEIMDRDRFSWLKDEEFGRQTLASLNSLSLQLVTEWPLISTLDPEIYGPPESSITTEMIEEQIRGFMTVEEALEQKKLFMLDYHDLFLPFVSKVRKLKNTALYGSRTIFFLNPDSTLRPLAIELVCPPMDGKPQWKQTYTQTCDATGVRIWRLAKAHVLAHESDYHQLISHWLRTHACIEPYIIAGHRQLSVMHPIYRLLHPHFRYRMEINGLAREALVNAEGNVESSFSPGKYCMEMSSIIYDKLWRFDQEALPQDLISRGMAVEDPSSPNGIKLTIEEYPYASDGLLLWDAIKSWVSDYVNHYYPEPSLILSDEELQAFWTEVRTVGHGDKKDEPWWPELKTPKDLIEIITIIIWVTSGHHVAVNFGQYAYTGYMPNRPTITRLKIPNEDPADEGWKLFMEKPEYILLLTFPSEFQAAKVITALNVLSTHSPNEEYMGEKIEPGWAQDPLIKAAFEKFNGRLKQIKGIIDKRNDDPSLKNRNGAGSMPFELLKPFSETEVTAN